MNKVPYYTTLAGAVAAARGIEARRGGSLEVRSLQDYFRSSTHIGETVEAL
jgi:carbamoyl-phosphate synthase large subunit